MAIKFSIMFPWLQQAACAANKVNSAGNLSFIATASLGSNKQQFKQLW
jgi:hypothetical protein